MNYRLVLSPEAARQFGRLVPFVRGQVRDALERHLRHEPTRTSRSRIKRLKGMARPQYQLRIGEVRVYYDVTDEVVAILAIVSKSDADGWLAEAGEPE